MELVANEKAPKESSQKVCQERPEEPTADFGAKATGSVINKYRAVQRNNNLSSQLIPGMGKEKKKKMYQELNNG